VGLFFTKSIGEWVIIRMGVYLGLDILPWEIESAEWEGFYDEVMKIINAFPLPVLRLGYEEKFGYRRLLLSRNPESQNERGRYLAICGDARTGQCAEQFIIFRDLQVYRKRYAPDDSQAKKPERKNQAGWPILLREEDSVRVFYEKTQSRPYHDLIWSIVTLAENLFPGRACATGNLNARRWQETLQWLESVTDRRLQKPLLLDAERLWYAFGTAFTALERAQKVTEKLVGGPAPFYSFLKLKDPALLRVLVKNRLKEYNSRTVGALSECLYILDGTEDLRFLVEVACLEPDGPRWELTDVLSSAYYLGAFVPEGKAPDATLAVGFLPAEFLPEYYHTDFYLEKELACRQVAEVTGLPVQKIEEMILEIEKENKSDSNKEDKEKIPFYTADSEQPSSDKPDHTGEPAYRTPQVEIPYPQELINTLKEQVAAIGKNWDSSTLHHLVAAIASKKNVVLTEEAWKIVDEEKDPDLLAVILGIMNNYHKFERATNVIEFILKQLPDIKESWENGRPWKYPGGHRPIPLH
jgi:hypothetical protein